MPRSTLCTNCDGAQQVTCEKCGGFALSDLCLKHSDDVLLDDDEESNPFLVDDPCVFCNTVGCLECMESLPCCDAFACVDCKDGRPKSSAASQVDARAAHDRTVKTLNCGHKVCSTRPVCRICAVSGGMIDDTSHEEETKMAQHVMESTVEAVQYDKSRIEGWEGGVTWSRVDELDLARVMGAEDAERFGVARMAA